MEYDYAFPLFYNVVSEDQLPHIGLYHEPWKSGVSLKAPQSPRAKDQQGLFPRASIPITCY